MSSFIDDFVLDPILTCLSALDLEHLRVLDALVKWLLYVYLGLNVKILLSLFLGCLEIILAVLKRVKARHFNFPMSHYKRPSPSC